MHRLDRRRAGAMTGCLAVLAVLLVLLVVGGIFVAIKWRSWVATGVESTMMKAVEAVHLPDGERAAIEQEITTLMQEFRDKKVSLEQLVKVAEEVSRSPMLPAASVLAMQASYLDKSGLSAEEKDAGSGQVARFAWGMYGKTIPDTKLDDVLKPIATRDIGGGNLRFREVKDVTDEDLRTLFANAKAEADAAGVPDPAPRVNVAEEFSKAVDRALGRESAESGG